MSLFDEQYLRIAEKILSDGVLVYNRTEIKTFKLPHQIMQFDLREEFPIITTKKLAFKTAIKELLWIFVEQSNDVKKLQKSGVHIWDKWMMEDDTIGTSYGWIVKKYHQVDHLIETLKNNPQDRRMMINLWQIPYLETGALYPCCFTTIWDVTPNPTGKNDYLNCMLLQRSGDWGLGVPFNTTQYAVLVAMIAQISGYLPGLFTHVINNAHIYENQVEGISKQIERLPIAYNAPVLQLNPKIENFYDYTIDDIKLIDYKSHDSIKMEVSV